MEIHNKILGALCLLLAGATPLAARDGPAFGPGIAGVVGVWMPEKYSERLLTAAGDAPPLNAAGAALYQARAAEHDAPQPQFDRTRWCAGPGMPRIMFMPYPFEIRADGEYIGFIYSWYRWHRMVDMSGAEPDIELPVTMGYAVGHWEGKTLVIRTTGTAGETVLDGFGLPHSEDMVLTENLRILANGRLEARYTIEDPAFYLKPWDAVTTYRRSKNAPVVDDVCPDRIANGQPAVRKKLP
jgi:hypothetical protein